MPRLLQLTEQVLGLPVRAAGVMHYEGWLQEQALRQQFRGPLMVLRPLAGSLGREERERARRALTTARLPELAVMAVSDAGLHVLSAGGLRVAPRAEVIRLAARTFLAASQSTAFTTLLRLHLPDGLEVVYEASRGELPGPRPAVVDAALAMSATARDTDARTSATPDDPCTRTAAAHRSRLNSP